MKRFCYLLMAFIVFSSAPSFAEEKTMPRILIGLYDSQWESSPRPSLIHRFLEMPANHLGYDIHYYDIRAPLPKLGDDVAGIIVWFDAGTQVTDPVAYLSWLEDALEHNKNLILVEYSGVIDKVRENPDILKRWNKVLSHLGLHDDSSWRQVTYDAHITYLDKAMVGFERNIRPPFAPLAGLHVLPGNGATTHLRISTKGDEEIFDLVSTSPHGGYIAPDYALLEQEIDSVTGTATLDSLFLWYVNPFAFLKKSLDHEEIIPVPDATTLDGKRIFYSHIDGDGWNNVSEIPGYQEHNGISAEVIYDQILKPYSDFVFNVALITADIDLSCYGVKDSEKVAREIFALPNVEPASHTYSHPLFWEFFANYSADMEKPFLHLYPPKPGQGGFSLSDTVKNKVYGVAWPTTKHPDSNPEPIKITAAAKKAVKRGSNEESMEYILEKYYDTPRSYACSPFNLKQEIVGAVDTINSISPPGKKVKLLQWSGDTSPFEAALKMTRESGLLNINGGDSRFDREYPSYSYVAPMGILIGNERQIYSSNSNEDTYTNLWKDRFFGYRYLQTTVKNTESPIRVSPFNIYFHIFSGEKQASLNAVKENLEFARKQNIIRITATEYSAIAGGFYTAKISKLSDYSWKITDRGALQTMRFDNPGNVHVDYTTSQGVIGEQLFQNSLYVALDPTLDTIILVLQHDATKQSQACSSYLIESTWKISGVQRTGCKKLAFEAQGFGPGVMSWQVPAGTYSVKIDNNQSFNKSIVVKEDGILSLDMGAVSANEPITIHIDPL